MVVDRRWVPVLLLVAVDSGWVVTTQRLVVVDRSWLPVPLLVRVNSDDEDTQRGGMKSRA